MNDDFIYVGTLDLNNPKIKISEQRLGNGYIKIIVNVTEYVGAIVRGSVYHYYYNEKNGEIGNLNGLYGTWNHHSYVTDKEDLYIKHVIKYIRTKKLKRLLK